MGIQMDNITSSPPQPFEFEKLVDKDDCIKWLQNNWHHSIYWSLLYACVIFITKQCMKNRLEFDLRPALAVWNMVLAIFSICGTVRTTPGLVHILYEFGFTFSVCDKQYFLHIQPFIFWGWLFILSKLFELGDTIFIVLRKRKLIFLHWYHHIMALILTWYTSSSLIAVGHWLIVINYAVHSLMYTYFLLSSVGLKLPRKFAMFVTSIQLGQMVIVVFLYYWAISTKYVGGQCPFPLNGMIFGLCLFLSYVFLFGRLFYFSYIKVTSKTKSLKSE